MDFCVLFTILYMWVERNMLKCHAYQNKICPLPKIKWIKWDKEQISREKKIFFLTQNICR